MNEELIKHLGALVRFENDDVSIAVDAIFALESADRRIAEIESQLSECQKDAERYRFVRNKPEMLLHLSNREFDRSIDKAIEETRK